MNRRVLFLQLLLLAVCLPNGCSDRSERHRRDYEVKGVAKKINLNDRVVSMLYVNDRGEEIEVEGTFTDDTIVMINGRTQTMKDIRPGDKVRVRLYSEGKGGAKKYIATRVEITRSTDWVATGQATSQAASQPQTKKH